MAAEHAELQKSIAALEGIQAWRDEVEQLEQVGVWEARWRPAARVPAGGSRLVCRAAGS
jgi:hypothetical protein